MIQGTPEWHESRRGKLTASNISVALSRRGEKPGASAKAYAAQLIEERVTGVVRHGYQTPAMTRGQRLEGEAADYYAASLGVETRHCGFRDHPTLPGAGASPDRYVGDDGLLEVKCLCASAHHALFDTQVIPRAYKLQVFWQLACCPERRYNDFVGYHPDARHDRRLFRRRFWRDDIAIASLEAMATPFLSYVSKASRHIARQLELAA